MGEQAALRPHAEGYFRLPVRVVLIAGAWSDADSVAELISRICAESPIAEPKD
jgi:hypothetical protein